MIKLILIIYLGLLFQACTYFNKKSVVVNNDIESHYITDSISPYGDRIIKYGNDSIFIFENGNLSSVLYLDTVFPIERISYYPNKVIQRIEYRPHYSKDSIFDEWFYDDSARIVAGQTFLRDTIIYSGDNPILCNKLILSFYQNNQIKDIGYYGSVSGYNIYETSIGLHRYYSEAGVLIKTSESIYSFQYNPYAIINEFHKNGILRQEKQYIINYQNRESDEIDKPIGIWKYYDETGKLIKTEQHSVNK